MQGLGPGPAARLREDPELVLRALSGRVQIVYGQTLSRLGLSHEFSAFRGAAVSAGWGATVAEHARSRPARDRSHRRSRRSSGSAGTGPDGRLPCAGVARRDSLRRARRRHRQRPERRLDHRDRERARRMGDHPSAPLLLSARLPASPSEAPSHAPITPHSQSDSRSPTLTPCARHSSSIPTSPFSAPPSSSTRSCGRRRLRRRWWP